MDKTKHEKRVRELRDIVYGKSTDAGWEACRENWLKEDATEWLENEVEKIKETQPKN